MLDKLSALHAKCRHWWEEKTAKNESQPTQAKKVLSELSQVTLSSLLPYQSYDPETSLYINKRSAGFVLEVMPLLGSNEENVSILTALITDSLPIHADLQILLWSSDKVGGVLDRFEALRRGKGELFEWLAKMRADHFKRGAYQSLTKSGPFLIRFHRLFLVVSMPCKHVNAVTPELMTLREDFQSSLKSMNIPSGVLGVTDFISVLSDLISPTKDTSPAHHRWHEMDELSQQVTNPECMIRVHADRLSFEKEDESWDVRCFGVRDFPSAMSQSRMTDSIGQLFNSALQIPCPFLTSLHIKKLPHTGSSLGTKVTAIEKGKEANSDQAKWNSLAREQAKEWTLINKQLQRGDRLVKTFYQVVLMAPEGQATMAERKLRDLYRANGWKLGKERYLQFQSWLAILPMLMTEGLYADLSLYKRLRTMTAFNAINIAPLQGEWHGTKTPAVLLTGRRGQLTTWSPFDNEEGNYNVAIAAASGKGKSVFAEEYINSILGSGGRVWVVDIGRTYEKICNIHNGEFIAFSEKKPICINPFSLVRNLDESMEMLKPLLASMARPSGRASDEELSFIEQAIKATFDVHGKASTITLVAAWLKNQDNLICQNLHNLLYSYTAGGMYARYFEGEATINFDNRLVVLELQELKSKKDLQRIVLLVLMQQISAIMYLGDRTQYKSCIIDEAWDLLGGDNESAAKFIEAGYRTARRFTGNFITITQSINDYFKNSTSLAAFDNSDHRVILAQNPEAFDQLKKNDRLNMDPNAERLYKSLRKTDEYSECVIKSPSGMSVHRIMLDPYSLILYSSKGIEFDAVKNWQAQGVPLKEAIALVAEGRFPNNAMSPKYQTA